MGAFGILFEPFELIHGQEQNSWTSLEPTSKLFGYQKGLIGPKIVYNETGFYYTLLEGPLGAILIQLGGHSHLFPIQKGVNGPTLSMVHGVLGF